MVTLYTIGHSTHPIDEFINLLKTYGIAQLVDIRSVPGSRHNPQFGQVALKDSLENNHIHYRSIKQLGGLRTKTKHSSNMGWHNESFRNYADYMQTDEFAVGINELISHAEQAPTVIMCAEAVPWRCHRSLVGDALVARNVAVYDIMSEKSAPEHALTSFAVVQGTNITYPTDR